MLYAVIFRLVNGLLALIIGLAAAVAVGLIIVQVTPIPLGPLQGIAANMAARSLGDVDISFAETRIDWSRRQNLPVLVVGAFRIVDEDGAEMILSDVEIAPSGDAFWRHGELALASFVINDMQLFPARNEAVVAPTGRIFASFAGGNTQTGFRALTYLEQIAIRDIVIAGQAEQSGPSLPVTGGEIGKSEIFLERVGDNLTGIVNLNFNSGNTLRQVYGTMSIRPGTTGNLDLTLKNINPDDISGFSRLFVPLQALALPVNAELNLLLDGSGRPQSGKVRVGVRPGQVNLAGRTIEVNSLDLQMEANFPRQLLFVSEAAFDINDISFGFTGQVDYELTPDQRIRDITADITGTRGVLATSGLFEQPVKLSGWDASLVYDAQTRLLTFDRLNIGYAGSQMILAGKTVFTDDTIGFNITTKIGAGLSHARVLDLWPLPVSPRTRKWASENLLAGDLTRGEIVLRGRLSEFIDRARGTPIREDAFNMDLRFANASFRFLKNVAPLEEADLKLRLGGSAFDAELYKARLQLPSAPFTAEDDATEGDAPAYADIANGTFKMSDYRNPALPAKIAFDAKADVTPLLRFLKQPRVNALRNVNFDTERLSGRGAARVQLSVPLRQPRRPGSLDFNVSGELADVAVDGNLAGFTLSDGDAFIDVSRAAMRLRGTIQANKVPVTLDWQQNLLPPNAEKAKASRLAVSGVFDAQDFMALRQPVAASRMLSGRARTSVLVEGGPVRPTGYRVFADLEQAEFALRPFAYEKPVGVPADLVAMIDLPPRPPVAPPASDPVDKPPANKIAFDGLDIIYREAGQEQLNASMQFDDGKLTKLTAKPLTLGDTEDLRLAGRVEDGKQVIEVTAKQFDMSKIGDAGNPDIETAGGGLESFFNLFMPDLLLAVQIDKLLGQHNESLSSFGLRLNSDGGIIEGARIEGIFADGYELFGEVARDSTESRRFSLQTENVSNLGRLVGFLPSMSGGSMLFQGQLWDRGVDWRGDPARATGRMDIVSFRAREVPVLARLLSLASFQGFADTLAGDGIRFRRFEFKYRVEGDLMKVRSGRMNGPAVGLTAQGDFNLSNGAHDFAGTVIPAYELNSLFSHIPIIGRILTGRRGEGLLGVGYRLFGESGRSNIIINPLSLFTPGIFRRIFELGIGLSDKDKEEDLALPPRSYPGEDD